MEFKELETMTILELQKRKKELETSIIYKSSIVDDIKEYEKIEILIPKLEELIKYLIVLINLKKLMKFIVNLRKMI